MFRITVASILLLALTGIPARAADDTDATSGGGKGTVSLPVVVVQEQRPAALPALYLSLAGLQAYDVYSTHAGLARGAAEANPLMAPMAGETAGMIVIKAVSTATTIVIAERLWRTNKTAAILTMVVANGVMAAVAANNARVLHQAH